MPHPTDALRWLCLLRGIASLFSGGAIGWDAASLDVVSGEQGRQVGE